MSEEQPKSDEAKPKRRRRSTWTGTRNDVGTKRRGSRTWAWVVVLLCCCAIGLAILDMRHAGRVRLHCRGDGVELQQSRRFPWPFGYEALQGSINRATLKGEPWDCQGHVFADLDTAQLAFVDLLIDHVRRALRDPASTDLKALRRVAQQAASLTRGKSRRTRHAAAGDLLADIAYRQGRDALSQVEDKLRTALNFMRETQAHSAERYSDLEDWIEHLESLLARVTPSPGNNASSTTLTLPNKAAVPGLAPLPLPLPRRPPLRPTPSAPSLTPPNPQAQAIPDGGPHRPDAGSAQPASGSGILM